MDSSQHILAVNIAGYSLGGVFVIAAVLQHIRWQIALTTVLSWSIFLLFQSDAWTASLFGNSWVEFFAFTGVGLAMLAISRLLLQLLAEPRKALRRALIPQLWEPQPAPPLTRADLFKRWFVTVAAATGALVGMMVRGPEFRTLLWNALQLDHALSTLLLVVVSFTLIGPVEEYIFDVSLRDEVDATPIQPGRLERLLEGLSGRAYRRLALVLVLVLLYPILLGCVEARFHTIKSEDVVNLIQPCIAPAFVTYYWAAALQRGSRSIARSAGAAATTMMTLFAFGAASLGFGALSVPFLLSVMPAGGDQAGGLALGIGAVIGFCLALPWAVFGAALTAGIPAVVGGAILGAQRRKRRNRPLLTIVLIALVIGGMLMLGVLAEYGLIAIAPMNFPGLPSLASALSYVMATVGWGAGLIVSGFPDIFKRAVGGSRTAAAEQNAPLPYVAAPEQGAAALQEDFP